MRVAAYVTGLGVCAAGCVLVTDLDALHAGRSEPCEEMGCADAASGDADAPDALDDRDVDAAPAGDAGDGATGPALVQARAGSGQSGVGAFALDPTSAGDLVVVAVVQGSDATTTVSSVSDDAPGGGNAYVSADVRSVDTGCTGSTEVWYAKDARAGARTVTVRLTGTIGFEAWVLELSGVDRTAPLDTGAVVTTQPSGQVVTAPQVTPSSPSAVVVSTAFVCTRITGIRAGNPFTALPIRSGNDTAYFIARQSGTYGAAWSYNGGGWSASTVAFE